MKIAFCIPGKEFTGWFLENWTELTQTLTSSPYIENLDSVIDWKLFRNYHPIINKTRTEVYLRAKTLNPDYYMWIDSDQVFKSEDFYSLISRDLDIISGVYYRSTGDFYNKPEKFACSMLDGPTLRMKDIVSKESPIEIHANGMGFMLVKSEVFRILNQPFMPENEKQWEGEDFTFQEKARKKGFKSYIDPKVIIGHEKKFIM